MKSVNDNGAKVDPKQVKRLLEFRLKGLEEREKILAGAVVTYRALTGKSEREHAEISKEIGVIRAHLASYGDENGPAKKKASIDEGAKGSCDGCVHRHFVNADPFGTSRSGFGCLLSGGHAVERCDGYEAVDSTLDNIRSLVAKIQTKTVGADEYAYPSSQLVDDAAALANCVDQLDQWMQKGGALPSAWARFGRGENGTIKAPALKTNSHEFEMGVDGTCTVCGAFFHI